MPPPPDHDRPHPTRLDDGAHAVVDGTVLVRGAFQPIFRNRGEKLEPVAFEALARPGRAGAAMLAGHYFASLDGDALPAIETLLRRMHLRNARTLPGRLRRLFLNMHPAGFDGPAAIEDGLRQLGEEVRAAGISPADLVCEITEHAQRSTETLKHLVYALRARGYRVAVDDFGAAFADTGRVAQLTPDIVKLDGKLVRRHLANADGVAELTRVVAAFGGQGIACVLEGLETFEQVERARRTGASFLQGFALGAPKLAPARFAEFKPAAAGVGLVKTLR